IDTEHTPPLHRYSRNVAFQVWQGGTRLILHSASAPDTRLSDRQEGFSDSVVAGRGWRVFSAWDARSRFLVQVGERRKARDELGETITEHMLRPLLVALPVLGLLIWFGVGAGLRSLRTLSEQVAVRRPENLTPLDDASAPSEIAPLVKGLNRLFARVHASLENERRFTADAAHELRTPLAAIRAQAQVAQASTTAPERSRALDKLLEGCDRAAHTVDQLLTLARLEPEQPRSHERHDLRALAAAVIAEQAPAAISRHIDLQLAEGDAAPVACEPALIAILMRNLIDNAIRYSPPHSVVRVDVVPTAEGIEFSVTDQGPGIPGTEQERVWERFYRVLGTGESGSGLGLSIVKRIADLHHATACFAPNAEHAGLRVSVLFSS
ncbi:MAG: ATP-binding protein, partial [Gammaproteobacteria bacterium]|nr:ATP-binding protein [Gammaproteobacteria bacterium]